MVELSDYAKNLKGEERARYMAKIADLGDVPYFNGMPLPGYGTFMMQNGKTPSNRLQSLLNTCKGNISRSIILLVMEKAIYSSMKGNIQRRHTMQRLIIFPEDEIPDKIRENISSQIKQLRKVPKVLTEEEIQNFPRVMKLPTDFVPS